MSSGASPWPGSPWCCRSSSWCCRGSARSSTGSRSRCTRWRTSPITRSPSHNLRLFLTEIDLFLIGATLIIAAIGLYELFIARIDPANLRRPMPAWLEMKDLNDLKARVIAMIILVCAVTFTDVLLEFGHNELDILYLAAGVAIFVIALTVFLRYGSDNGGDHA